MVDIDREKLVDVLRSVAGVVESDNSISGLQRLCFRDGTVCGSNGTIAIIASCAVQESFCVDAEHLLRLHARLETDQVSWTFSDNKLIVKSGRHKSEVLTSDARTFPNFLPASTTTLCANAEGFANAIKKCLSFSDDAKQPQLNGIGCKGQYVYGVDSVQCVRVKVAGTFAEKITIPRTAAKILSGFGDPMKILLTPGNSNIVLLYPGKVVVCRLLESLLPFDAVDGVFGQDESHAVNLIKELPAAVNRVSLILKAGGVTLRCKDGSLMVLAEQESAGNSSELTYLLGAHDFECKVNPNLFAKAASSFEMLDPGDVISGAKRFFRFSDPTSRYAMALMT